MRNTPFNTGSSERSRDMTVWLLEGTGDNGLQLERLRRNLRRAKEQELTPCQQQVLELRYERNMSVTQIAHHLGVNVSTVSRTLRRAQERLQRYLQYTL